MANKEKFMLQTLCFLAPLLETKKTAHAYERPAMKNQEYGLKKEFMIDIFWQC